MAIPMFYLGALMIRRTVLQMVAIGALSFAISGCGTPEPTVELQGEVLTAGCGMCIYGKTLGTGCYWAVEHQGDVYPVSGPVPKDHENHAPTGMCNMKRQVRVDGTLRSTGLAATQFELLPPEAVPNAPKFTPEDVH